MKNKPLLALLFSSLVACAQAQSLERQVIGSAGNYQTAAWGSISNTAGECITSTLITAALVLTQGFQQPLQSDVFVYEVPANNITVEVFPNPASDVINVVINSDDPGKHYSVILFDMPGQQLKLSSIGTETKRTFDLRSIANGTYLIHISDEHSTVKTIKFTKNSGQQ